MGDDRIAAVEQIVMFTLCAVHSFFIFAQHILFLVAMETTYSTSLTCFIIWIM